MDERFCPDRSDLLSFRLGKLDEEQLEDVAEHLETCVACRSTVEGIGDADDTLASALRRPPADPFLDEPECRRAVAAVEAIGGRAAPPLELAPLRAVRDYRLLEPLGRGGMGTVYKAEHARLKRIVAVKLLPEGHLADAHAVARFARETEVVGRLEHSHIVRALDAGEHAGLHYLVMEYVPGLDLSRLLQRHGPLRIADACEIARQAAAGLHHAHEHGMVHRDVKPSNLILTPAGQVKLLDLGLARFNDAQPRPEASAELTASGQVMGTFDFMAPEQATDSHEAGPAADVYGLGATLYKLLTGAAPFESARYGTGLKRITALALHEAPPITERRPDVPPALAAAVHRMLARDPARRFQTAAEAAAELAPFAAGPDLPHVVASVLADPAARQTVVGSDGSTAPVGVRVDETAAPKAGATDRTLIITPAPERAGPQTAPRRRRVTPARAAAAALLLGGLVAAAFVIHVKTDRGELVIESEHPDVQVTLRRQDGDERDLQLSLGRNAATVRSGTYEVVLSGANVDGLRVENDRFTLTRGGEAVVRVTRAAPDSRAAADGAAERAAARWALSLGGRVGFKAASGERQVTDAAELPGESFELIYLEVHEKAVADDDLRRLAGLKRLGWLDLTGTSVGDDGLAHLAGLDGLTTLLLADTDVTGGGLTRLRALPRLKTLHLHGAPVADAALAPLPEFPALTTLYLGGTRITDAGLGQLRRMRALRELHLRRTGVTASGAAELRRALPQCRIVHESGDTADDDFLRRVAALPPEEQVAAVVQRLKELNPGFDGTVEHCVEDGVVTQLSFTAYGVTDLSPVRALTGLKSLICAGAYERPARELVDLSPLAGLPLESLDIVSTGVSDLSPLAGMPLKVLKFGHTPVADLAQVSGLPLTNLACWGTRVTDLAPLQDMATLTVLDCSGNAITDLAPLAGLQLRQLSFSSTRVSDLTPLRGMPLEYVVCGRLVSDLSPLEDAPLADLRIGQSGARDLSPIAGKPLRRLDMPATSIDDLSPLRGMPLTHVHLELRFHDPADEELLRSLPLARINNRPAEEAWQELADCRQAAADFAASAAGLAPDEQAAAVKRRLEELNPESDIALGHTGEGGTVVEATLVLPWRHDLSPLRAFAGLRRLKLSGGHRLTDLSVLHGLPLEELTCEERLLPFNESALRAMTSLKTINGRPVEDALDPPDRPK